MVLIVSQILSVKADLALLYPVGGEKWPGNGKHTITWTNSDNLGVTVYLDGYDTSSTPFTDDYILYSSVLSAGTNTFVLSTPSRFPTNYQYKIRLVGTNSSLNITSTSGLINITGPATFDGQMTNQSPWIPGQTKNVTITWDGFSSNDAYSVILESPALNQADYGFLVTNAVINSGSGTQTFAIPYPSSPTAAYPPGSYALLDGPHVFTLVNSKYEIIKLSATVEIVTVGLRMSLAASDVYAILRGESNVCSSVVLDATSATNSVSVTNVAVIFTSFSTNYLSLKFTLKDGSQGLSTNTLSFTPSQSSQYSTKVDFPLSLTLTNGQVKELSLWCEVLPASGTGNFVWKTDEVTSVIQSSVGATYVGGASIGKTVISSASSFIDIVEVFLPKFFLESSQSNSVTYHVVCKPQTSYTIQSSTNLVNWDNDLTTNTVTDLIQFSMSVSTNGNKFFRIKEN